MTCPYCNEQLEDGFLSSKASLFPWGKHSYKLFFSKTDKLSFLGGPKGGSEDVSSKSNTFGYGFVPALKCSKCRKIIFDY